MGWSEPRRVRRPVCRGRDHVGYVTAVSYPHRDVTAFAEGTPFAELVVADLAEEHVALLQRFKAHWLIQCGPHYATAVAAGDLPDAAVQRLALLALASGRRATPELAEELAARVEQVLAPPPARPR